jgi:hypothetical protein
MTSAPLYGRAWNVQVLTPPDAAQQSTLYSVSYRTKRYADAWLYWPGRCGDVAYSLWVWNVLTLGIWQE